MRINARYWNLCHTPSELVLDGQRLQQFDHKIISIQKCRYVAITLTITNAILFISE